MRIIGLTGSIACGKSTVSAYLASRGCPVVDGDRLARELTAPGSPVLGLIRSSFGESVFCEDGSLNRRRLGQLIFSDPLARRNLDALMAPYLMSLTRHRIDELRSSGAPLCILDMPLLFEKGYDRLCDTVWTVWLPENVQISRLMARDGYSYEEAQSRIRSVLSCDEKASRADRVIDNSGPVENTIGIVSELLDEELGFSGKPVFRHSGSDTPESRGVLSVSDPVSPPESFTRPEAAMRSRRSPRKAAWSMPVWLRLSLIAAAAILAVSITALLIMNAYLHQCEETHIAEQNAIDRNYPLFYRDLIETYAAEYNLAPAYVAAIIMNESSFQPNAESGVGARGLMQLMPETAEWIAGKLHVSGFAFERMYDPESNIRFGCWYLNYLSRLFLGDPVAVTAAYHAGQGQVKVWLSDPNLSENGYTLSISSLPDGPTKKYAGRVTRDYGIYKEKYFSVDQFPADADNADPGLSGLSGDW